MNDTLSEYGFVYGRKIDFDPSFLKDYKKIFSKKIDGLDFLLFRPKNDKRKIKSLPLSPKYLFHILYDMEGEHTNNGFFRNTKTKKDIFIQIKGTSVTIEEKEEDLDSSIEDIIDNYFLGGSCYIVKKTEKDFEKNFKNSETGAYLLLFALLLVFGGLYYFTSEDELLETAKVRPPMPEVRPLTSNEKYYLDYLASKEFVDTFVEKVEEFKEKSLKMERLPFFSLVERIEIPQGVPEFNEDTNQWYYPNGEKYKRGGVSQRIAYKYEKKIASIGYVYQDEVDEHLIYQTNKEETKEYLGVDINSSAVDKMPKLTKKCLNAILRNTKSVPYEQTDEYLIFNSSKDNGRLAYDEFPKLMEICPLSFKVLSVADGKIEGTIYVKKK